MQTTIRILMTDDHPMIIEGYQNTLIATKKPTQNLKIDIANNCDESIKFMENSVVKNNPYNVLFMDISLPPSSDGKFNTGEDLAMHARRTMPQVKIIILTMFHEPYRINNIIRTIKPEGFLIKSDLTSRELANAFQAVLHNPPYYSGTVNSLMKKTFAENIVLDDVNRKILYLLSQGIKTKNLKEYIELSLSAIEKRKKFMKELFGLENGSDEHLLDKAKDKGII